MGLAIAGAIARRATTVLVFAPSAGNVQTLFEFIQVGLKALGNEEIRDYTLIKPAVAKTEEGISTNDVIGIDIHKRFR